MKINDISSIYYYAVILLIGLPTWYWSTTPPRQSLPDISGLMVHSQRIISRVKWMVVVCDPLQANEDNQPVEKNWLRQTLQTQFASFVNPTGEAAFQMDWRIRNPMENELDLLQRADNQTLVWLDSQLDELESHQSRGNVWIYVLSETLFDRLKPKRLATTDVIFGSNRFVYVRSLAYFEKNTDQLVPQLQNQLLNPQTDFGVTTQNKPSSESNALLHRKISLNLNLIMENASDSVQFATSSKYNDMQLLIEKAFLKSSGIYSLVDVNVISQFVHFALSPTFEEKNVHSIKSNKGEPQRVIYLDEIHTFLNQIEARLPPPIDKNVINFNILLPSSTKLPLFFFDKQTNTNSNSILTQSHGQLLVWNQEHDFNLAFKVFVRTLLGLPERQPDSTLRLDLFFSKLELDSVSRRVALAQLASTLASLESIEKLLNKGSNIVIEQQVAHKMHSAVELSHEAINNLENNFLEIAYKLSSKAFANAESAFYDPSLLTLLYFPEDQKYAIYFPLFLPVALQLVADFNRLRKKWFSSNTSKSIKVE